MDCVWSALQIDNHYHHFLFLLEGQVEEASTWWGVLHADPGALRPRDFGEVPRDQGLGHLPRKAAKTPQKATETPKVIFWAVLASPASLFLLLPLC